MSTASQPIITQTQLRDELRGIAGRTVGMPLLRSSCEALAAIALDVPATHERIVGMLRGFIAFRSAELDEKNAASLKAAIDRAESAGRADPSPCRVDPKAKLVIDDETGIVSLDFSDEEIMREVAAAYGLEIDATFLILGHCEEMLLPREYAKDHLPTLVDMVANFDVNRADRERPKTFTVPPYVGPFGLN